MDAWVIRVNESDGPLYLYEISRRGPVLVAHAEDAQTFSHAAARRALRKLGYSNAEAVRRIEALRGTDATDLAADDTTHNAERREAGRKWDEKYAGKGDNLAMGLAVGQTAPAPVTAAEVADALTPRSLR